MKKIFVYFVLLSIISVAFTSYAYAETDQGLVDRLKGRILLQVESKGEAWYLDPVTEKRFYLSDGWYAYGALKLFGLGITDENLEKIPIGIEERFEDWDEDSDGLADQLEEAIGTDITNPDTDSDGHLDGSEVRNGFDPLGTGKLNFDMNFSETMKGKILLQVESRGEAWYVSPEDGKRYYMKNGEAAYQIMKYLSLGITNENLEKIEARSLTYFSGYPTPRILFENIEEAIAYETSGKFYDLMLTNNELTQIPNEVRGLKHLITLDISRNNITDLSILAELENIQILYAGGNNISDLSPLSQIDSLRELYMAKNDISDITPISDLTNLDSIWMGQNKIEDITPLSKLKNLRNIQLDYNNISDVTPLSGLENLVQLYMGINNISDVSSLSNLTQMQTFYVAMNNITDISVVSNYKNLRSLGLSENNISDISALSDLVKLDSLYLNGNNNISDISALENLPNLTVLSLSNNNVSDISPIADAVGLTHLSFDYNNVSDISVVANFVNMEYLLLLGNNVSDITPVLNLTKLVWLGLSGNNLTEEDYSLVEQSLSNVEIL